MFAAFLLSWAPFRVTVRNGQISLMIMALLLGALVARRKKKDYLAGALLGLSLAKFTMTFPFLLYFVWKREWKMLSTAALIPIALTQVFAMRLGMTMIEAVTRYVSFVSDVHDRGDRHWIGTTEIKVMISGLAGGDERMASVITIVLILAGLAGFFIAARRSPKCETIHLAALSLLALWSSYHRSYDSVLCLIAVAAMIELHRRGVMIGLSRFWLAALGLLIVNIPGALTDRLNLSESELSGPLGFAGLHIERLLMFGFFWSLVWALWRGESGAGKAEEIDGRRPGFPEPDRE